MGSTAAWLGCERIGDLVGGDAAMLILGIDVGINGALCLLRDREIVELADMPAEVIGVAERSTGKVLRRRVHCDGLSSLLGLWRSKHDDDWLAVVERVGSMPGQGVATMFSLGESAGAIRGVLAGRRINHKSVEARVWKRRMNLGKDKNESRARASQLFPDHALLWVRAMDDGRAEAALIARFGWELYA